VVAVQNLVIPRTGDPGGHLAENMTAADLRLSAEEPARLDALHHAAGA
jgi:hypothetical protein